MDDNENTTEQPGSVPTVPLTSDFVFKYVFGGEHSAGFLRRFLSAVQEDAGYPAVAEVRITNPFNLKETANDKLSIVDVRATDIHGAIFTMEAQAVYHAAFASRALYYVARSYGLQLSESDFYTRLRPAVGINILDFRLFPREANAPMHTTFVPTCTNAPDVKPLSDLIVHFIELPQFEHSRRPLSTELGRWLYYIRYRGREGAMEDPIMKRILEESPEIAEADRRYREFIADEELRSRLEARDKFIKTQAQLMYDAEQKGLETGFEKGREQGREQGRLEGQEQGRRETARSLKARNMPTAEIAEVTGFSEQEIEEL